MKKQIQNWLFILGVVIPGISQSQIPVEKFPGNLQHDNFLEHARKLNMYYDTVSTGDKSGYKQWKRREWFLRHHLNEAGNVVDYYSDNYKAIKEIQGITEGNRSPNGSWANIGYSTLMNSQMALQGRTSSVAFDPVNSSTIYIASVGGIWKSTNNGDTWVNMTVDLPLLGVADIVVTPAPNNHILYALIGDPTANINNNPNTYEHNGVGVIKSYDSGHTWVRTGAFNTSGLWNAYKILMSPTDPNLLLAATSQGIFRTNNGGQSWSLFASAGDVTDMEFKTNNPDSLFYVHRADNNFYRTSLVPPFSIYSSPVTNLVVDRMEIGVTADNPNAIYVLAGPGIDLPPDPTNYFRGLFYYGGGGGPFTLKTNVCSNNGDLFNATTPPTSQSNYDIVVHVDPFEENNVIVGGVRLFGSINGGTTLNQITANNIHADHHNIKRNPSNGQLWLATDGGVYRSADNGNTWENKSDGLVMGECYRIACTNNASDVLLTGLQDNGAVLRDINDQYNLVISGDGMDSYFNSFDQSIVYACTQNGLLWRSPNEGLDFSPVPLLPNAGNPQFYPWITPILQYPPEFNQQNQMWENTDVVFVYSLNGIMRGGNNINFNNIGPAGIGWNGDCPSMAIGRDAEGTIFYISNGSTIWFTLDALSPAPIWGSFAAPNLNGGFISAMAINPTDAHEIWIVVNGYIAGTKVLRSTNAGADWSNVSLSLPNVPIYSIVFANQNNSPSGAIYIGSEVGVFYKDDNLTDWVPFTNGLPHVPVTDLEINHSNGTLKAATYGRGIWETDLFQNCPPTVVIDYDINQGQYNFESSDFIWALDTIKGGIGTRVTMKSASQVILTNGFKASENTYVRIGIGNCGTGPLPLQTPSPGMQAKKEQFIVTEPIPKKD